MNIQQTKNLLFLIQTAIGAPDPGNTNMYLYVNSSSILVKSIKFKRWKLRYIPGRCFIFNGKQKFQHSLVFPYYNNECIGVGYWRYGVGLTAFFNKPFQEIMEIYNYTSRSYLWINDYYHEHYICTDSSEERKSKFFENVSNDLMESLEINTDEDFEKFKSTINLIGIRNI